MRRLVQAVKDKSVEHLTALLSDVRIDPNKNLSVLIYEAREYVPSATVIALARHPRTNIDRLDAQALSIVLSSLESEELWPLTSDVFLSPTDVYSKLVRFVYVKHPSAIVMLQYIENNFLDEPEVREALSSTLNSKAHYSPTAAPIRALLLYIIYPDMTMTEHLEHLKNDGYTEDEVYESRLLSSYILR